MAITGVSKVANINNKYKDLLNPELSATTLSFIISDLYDYEWMNWEPAVLKAQIYEDLDIYPENSIIDKVEAVSLLQVTDQFTTNLDAFIPVCRVFADKVVDESNFLPAELEELIIGCTEAALHVGKIKKVHPDIKSYVGFILDQHGVYDPPELLSFANYPKDMEKEMTKLRGNDFVSDKVFWQDQKQMKIEMENAGLFHIKRILNEVSNLPIESNQDNINKISKSVSQVIEE